MLRSRHRPYRPIAASAARAAWHSAQNGCACAAALRRALAWVCWPGLLILPALPAIASPAFLALSGFSPFMAASGLPPQLLLTGGPPRVTPPGRIVGMTVVWGRMV